MTTFVFQDANDRSELDRKNNEYKRINDEKQRKIDESNRITKENERIKNENQRKIDETSRIEAEKDRRKGYSDFITAMGDSNLEGTIEAEVIGARGQATNLKERFDGVDKTIMEVESFTEYPQGTKPSKNSDITNSYKIIHKTNENQLMIVQNTNKGCVKYIFERNNGASVEGRDYGINHELLRLIGAYQVQGSYVYFDVSTPDVGSFDGVLYEPSQRNIIEQYLVNTPKFSLNNSFSSKNNGNGVGCYKLKYGTSVEYKLDVTSNNKANILFLQLVQVHKI